MPRSDSRTRITPAEYRTLAEMRYAVRRFLRFSEDAAQAVGLAPQQHQALLVIKGDPGPEPLTIGLLADRLQIRPHSAVGLTDRLVARRLVSRRTDRVDRRQVRLHLTSRGEKILEVLTVAHREHLRRLAPELAALFRRLSGRD
jgi:DNA-binding MarR family transcriptional regulator